MLKQILNLDGAQKLTKIEQSEILGGKKPGAGGGCCNPTYSCCSPQPIPYGCSECGAQAAPNCQYAYANPTCPSYPYYNCCI